MEIISFDHLQPIPIIDARVYGKLGARKVKLIFDTGAEFTILDTTLIEEIGYSAGDAKRVISISGPTGDFQEGYLLEIQALRFLI